MTPTRILVTGAAGFIGNACVREFLSRGFRVTALAHRRIPRGPQGMEMVSGSLSDRRSLASAIVQRGPFDAVVNCAGMASDVARTSRLMEANYHGVRNLVECMRQQPEGRLVQISTSDVYGIRDFVDADETTPLEDNLHQAYPRSKILAERFITATLPSNRYVILRPGAVCGPGDTTILPRVLSFLRHSRYVIHFGRWRGHNRWPLAHVRNVAKAAMLAATCDEALGQAYNVVDPKITTVEQYCRWVLRTFLPNKAAIKSLSVPLAAAWPYGLISSLASRTMGKDRPLFDPSLYALYSISSNLDFSSRKLQQLFDRHGEQFLDSFDTSGLPGNADADEPGPHPSEVKASGRGS